MMNPKEINIKDYHYILPDNNIAKYPLHKRDESRLLVYKNGEIKERVFKHIADEIPDNSLLVFNNTKVIHARVLFKRKTGAQIEIFCIEPGDGFDYQLVFSSKNSCVWKCMVGNAKRWKNDVLTKQVETENGMFNFQAEHIGKTADLFEIKFSWDNNFSFAEVLHHAGILPLPPYLNRDGEIEDEESYQTIFAKLQGSVAAPTAGLHFTDEVVKRIEQKCILTEVTLHVGAGTFRSIKSDTLEQHQMHEESIYIPLHVLKKLHETLSQKNKIIAVGTTSTRTLESIYWHGVKLINNQQSPSINIKQWEAYELNAANISAKQAVEAIIKSLNDNNLTDLQGSTQVIIAPGYAFKIVDVLITNFHQPENSLILLIAAFVGKNWRSIYNYALQNNFRFLSYGDSSILNKQT